LSFQDAGSLEGGMLWECGGLDARTILRGGRQLPA